MEAQLESYIPASEMLAHWQGHRGLTRRMIEAFPEDQLFTFSVGGMRPFGELALEMVAMGAPMLRGLVTGEWSKYEAPRATDRADLLQQWDAATDEINTLWAQMPAGRFGEVATAFGAYTMKVSNLLLYTIDNEVHHRGQGYVYLRVLGIEPPAFYER